MVIRDDKGYFLMVQEGQPKACGMWGLPGGHVDEGESLQQAAIRETKEEVGLDVELVDPEPIHIDHKPENNRTYYGFLAKVIGGELKHQVDELLDARWLSPEEIEILNKEGKIRSAWIIDSVRKVE